MKCSSRVHKMSSKKVLSHRRWRCRGISRCALAKAHSLKVVRSDEEADVGREMCKMVWQCWRYEGVYVDHKMGCEDVI